LVTEGTAGGVRGSAGTGLCTLEAAVDDGAVDVGVAKLVESASEGVFVVGGVGIPDLEEVMVDAGPSPGTDGFPRRILRFRLRGGKGPGAEYQGSGGLKGRTSSPYEDVGVCDTGVVLCESHVWTGGGARGGGGDVDSGGGCGCGCGYRYEGVVIIGTAGAIELVLLRVCSGSGMAGRTAAGCVG
jgi:hypothetical protein